MLMADIFLYCFFQAEDGIRDIGVTGVQTCALPISSPGAVSERGPAQPGDRLRQGRGVFADERRRRAGADGGPRRSEERRVGKERRSRGSSHHLKKNIRL